MLRTSVVIVVIAGVALMAVANRATGIQVAGGVLGPGSALPSTTFRLVNNKHISTQQLAKGKYVLWLFATWCPSCVGGTTFVAKHIEFLRAHGVQVVELEIYHNLGGEEPDVETIAHDNAGEAANSPLWHFGYASEEQSVRLDPKGDPDIYYLVKNNRVVAVGAAPAATWDQISSFAEGR